jgi:ATP:ADP antiporter, AAA family
VSLLSVVVQAGFSRRALARWGLARTAGSLSWVTAAGAAAALAAPGLVSALVARGAEAVTRNSLYRSAYELLFTPLPEEQKRAAKPLIDVGVLRIGDAAAAAVIQLLILGAAGVAPTVMLALALGLGVAGIALALPLHTGYVATLERSLLSRAVQLDLADVEDETTRSTLLLTAAGATHSGAVTAPPGQLDHQAGPHSLVPPDPVLARIERLRARNAAVVRLALSSRPLEAAHVPHAIALLAWSEVAPDATRALQAVATRHTGQLVDALLDGDQEFTVRRRLPDVLAHARSSRAVEGLWLGLEDKRFEVRVRCGRALAKITGSAAGLAVSQERVFDAIMREAAVDRQVWESQRLLDQADDAEAGFVDEVLKDRASRSLEHVFTLLSLALPRQALQVAFRGLHTSDAQLRGTALEYLEASLPGPIRERLWPMLDVGSAPRAPAAPRPREAIVADLLRSQESIAAQLAALQRGPGAV